MTEKHGITTTTSIVIKKIYKYPLRPLFTVVQPVELPITAHFLKFDLQLGYLTMWWELDVDQPREMRQFVLCPTGAELPKYAVHLETITTKAEFLGESLVWHLYEVVA